MRFITNARRTIDGKIIGELLPAEVKDAEEWLIRGSQEECFTEEYKLLKQGKSISKNNKLICLIASTVSIKSINRIESI